MKKIEKLELPYDDGKGNFSSGSGEIHILRKVNEIIDVLNSWVFEPTLTIPSQSQKQPEKCDCDYCKAYRFSMEKEPEEKLKKEDMLRWLRNGGILKLAEKQLEEDYKCGTLEVLKNPKLRKELLQKDNQVIKKNLTTEKQGEWREGLDNIDLMLAMLQSIENCTDEEVRNTAKAIREELDKVSQLLSERTFSKEELNRLSIWSGDVGSFGVVSDEDAELINKIYKLLDGEKE